VLGLFGLFPGFLCAIGCDGGGVHGWKLGVQRARWDGIEPSLYVSISSQQFSGGFGLVGIDGHGVALSAVRRRTFQAQLSLLRSPPHDREAVALQGRAERAGACDEPLAARPALAVVIPFSFTFDPGA
jgi:hypothetical protein